MNIIVPTKKLSTKTICAVSLYFHFRFDKKIFDPKFL